MPTIKLVGIYNKQKKYNEKKNESYIKEILLTKEELPIQAHK